MFNRKLKTSIAYLERKLLNLENILKVSIKCSNCGKSAMYKIFRKFKRKSNKLVANDILLCEDCFIRFNNEEKHIQLKLK